MFAKTSDISLNACENCMTQHYPCHCTVTYLCVIPVQFFGIRNASPRGRKSFVHLLSPVSTSVRLRNNGADSFQHTRLRFDFSEHAVYKNCFYGFASASLNVKLFAQGVLSFENRSLHGDSTRRCGVMDRRGDQFTGAPKAQSRLTSADRVRRCCGCRTRRTGC